jgi:hypothetical protein
LSLDEIPEPTDEELAEMEAALDQGDEFDFYEPYDWDDVIAEHDYDDEEHE